MSNVGSSASGKLSGQKRKGIKWDEVTIAEHDKERGTRKKILEPKTPYRPPRDVNSAGSVGSVTNDDSMNTGGGGGGGMESEEVRSPSSVRSTSSFTQESGGLRMEDARLLHAALHASWDSEGSESEQGGTWGMSEAVRRRVVLLVSPLYTPLLVAFLLISSHLISLSSLFVFF